MRTDGLLTRLKKQIDEIGVFRFYLIVQRVDKFLSKEFFDLKEFNAGAWYYSSDGVREWFSRELMWRPGLPWYAQDEAHIIKTYFRWLINYDLFIFFLLALYFWFLVLIVVVLILLA